MGLSHPAAFALCVNAVFRLDVMSRDQSGHHAVLPIHNAVTQVVTFIASQLLEHTDTVNANLRVKTKRPSLNLHHSQNCTPTLRRSGTIAPREPRFDLQRIYGVRGIIPRDLISRPMISRCKISMSHQRRNYILPVFPKTSKRGRLHLAQHHQDWDLIRSSPHVASKLSPHGADNASNPSALRDSFGALSAFPAHVIVDMGGPTVRRTYIQGHGARAEASRLSALMKWFCMPVRSVAGDLESPI